MRAALLPLMLVSGLSFLAACGDVPQPFRREGTAEGLARPRLVRGVVVHPVADIGSGRQLSEAVVAEFAARDIPATLRPATLKDATSMAATPRDVTAWEIDGIATAEGNVVGVVWSLRPPGGGEPSDYFTLAHGWRLAGGDRAELKRIAGELVTMAIGPVDPGRPTQPVQAAGPRIAIAPFGQLPGDGAQALKRALTSALEREGLLVTGDNGDYMVVGTVLVGPGLPGEDLVDVAWTLKDRNGKDIGTVAQQGAVPKGQLNQPWGALARDIASGGAEGVLDLLRKAKEGR